jgi:AmpD protein
MSRHDLPRAIWRGGWLWPCLHQASPNFGVRPADAAIDLLLLHSISLPPGRYGGDAIRQLFTNRLDWDEHPYYEGLRGLQVSAHFVIRRTGALWQFVDCDQRAWHAGASSFQGRPNCNDYAIGIELEGLEDCPFEAVQYRCLSWLCSALLQRYALRHITGHEHVAPGRKRDPGAGFDWFLLQQLTHQLPLRIAPALQPADT